MSASKSRAASYDGVGHKAKPVGTVVAELPSKVRNLKTVKDTPPAWLSKAYKVLEDATIRLDGCPVGTVASFDPEAPAQNYAECFVRDFVPSALVYMNDGHYDIVRNFLDLNLSVRDQLEQIRGHIGLPKIMPASFTIECDEFGKERVNADFGDRAIGRVAPVDSMMWWVLLLRAYTSMSGDEAFAQGDERQRGLRMILDILLRDHFEVFPTLLVPDGSFMIDRRMGVFGHPLEIQVLFFASLRAALSLLNKDNPANAEVRKRATERLAVLRSYVRTYYWLNLDRLNEIHRYRTEMFGRRSSNALNIYPESMPDWVQTWLPDRAGYLVGNLGPGRMDFRFFAFGNLAAVLFGLATHQQSAGIFQMFDERWDDLIGNMPVKICYPAMEGAEWHLLTGADPKNIPWSYHNGGNWPTLLWSFVGAAVTAGRGDLAERAFALAEERLPDDHWPEYYDGRNGRLIGRRSNLNQTWTAAALILGRTWLHDNQTIANTGWLGDDDDD